MVMNAGGHIKADGPLIKDKHTGCLPQKDQAGGFPTNTLVEQDPWRRISWWGPPNGGEPLVEDPLMEEDHLGPQEDKDHQALKDQQDL